MDRPVALGSSSGVASTLILALLKTFVQEPFIDPPPLQPPLHCPQFELAFEDIPLWTFAAGVFWCADWAPDWPFEPDPS